MKNKIITLSLYASVLLAIKEHAENELPFSALDITNYIEVKIDGCGWELCGANLTHETVRTYVHEIMDNRLLELDAGNYKYIKTYEVGDEGKRYKQYDIVFDEEAVELKVIVEDGRVDVSFG